MATKRIKAVDARRNRYGNVSATTMWRWTKYRGFPKGLRVGRDTLLDVEELDAWDAEQFAKAAAEKPDAAEGGL